MNGGPAEVGAQTTNQNRRRALGHDSQLIKDHYFQPLWIDFSVYSEMNRIQRRSERWHQRQRRFMGRLQQWAEMRTFRAVWPFEETPSCRSEHRLLSGLKFYDSQTAEMNPLINLLAKGWTSLERPRSTPLILDGNVLMRPPSRSLLSCDQRTWKPQTGWEMESKLSDCFHIIVYSVLMRAFSYEQTHCQMLWSDWSDRTGKLI